MERLSHSPFVRRNEIQPKRNMYDYVAEMFRRWQQQVRNSRDKRIISKLYATKLQDFSWHVRVIDKWLQLIS